MRKRKLTIRFSALLFFCGTFLSDAGGVGAAILLAAGLHECGHILAARLLHIPLRGFCLDLLGARLEVRGRMLSYGEEWLLAAAGPIASLIVSALAAPFWAACPFAVAFSCASLLLGLLNLLPIRTFDGGRMLETALLAHLSQRRAGQIVRLLTFSFLFLLWAGAVYLLLRVGDGLSLFCFSMSLLSRFFDEEMHC